MNNIALFLRSMGEHGMAEEVEAEHNRLEAFAGGLDKDCLDAQFKAGAASRDAEVAELKTDYLRACQTTAQMHAAAVGEITGPKRGVVEDVADLRAEREQLRDQVKDQRITILQLRAILQGLGHAREPKP